MNDTACPFCKKEKLRSRLIYEGNRTFVILSDPRLMKGHILVLPKRHVEKLSELSQEEKDELWHMVEEFQEKLLATFGRGCDVDHHSSFGIFDSRWRKTRLDNARLKQVARILSS